MAIDPNAATVQPSGWALGGLGAPSQSTIPLARPQSVLTPEQIAQLRQQALTLQQPPQGGIHHWTQGLAELARAIQGNREADFARQQEQANREADISTNMALFPQTPGGPPAPAAGGAPAGAGGGASTGSAAQATGSDPRGMGPYIRETAAKYGVDPDTAMKVAQSEGLGTFLGDGGKSGGAFQLYTGGGMGNDFQKETGLDPLDPKNEKATIDYALKNVPRTGWTPFHGARRVGIGERDGILPQPDAVANTPPQAAAPTPAPTGLLAPIQPPAAASAAPLSPVPSAPPAATAPTRLAYAGNPPAGMVPPAAPPASPLSPMISAIAGQPIPPTDFARQAAAMEAAKAGGAAPLPAPGAAIPPADFARQAAAMEAAKGSPAVPPTLAALPAQAGGPAAAPQPSVPAVQAGPAAPIPPPFIPSGGSTPGAIGPTAVNGQPLDYTASLPRPPLGAPPAASAPMVNAIAGRPMPPPVAPAAGGGAPIPPAPGQVAQNGPPTSAVPSPAGGPSGLPQPMIAPHPSLDQLRAVIQNPRSSPQMRAVALQQAQALMQPQSMPYGTGTIQFIPGTGQKQYVEGPAKTMDLDMGGIKIPHQLVFDPATGQYSLKNLMAGPTGGPAGQPAQSGSAGGSKFDFSTPEAAAAASAAMAGEKKGAEAGGEARAKYLDSLKRGVLGTAMIASQQKQNLDALEQVANSPDLETGTFGDPALGLQRLGASLGINPTAAAPRELFNMLAARVLGDQISGLKSLASETGEAGGRIFKPMLDIEEKSNITPQDSTEGVKAKIKLFNQMGDLAIRYGTMADKYIHDHGALDEEFDHQLRQEIAKSRLPNIVPQPSKSEQSTAPTPPAAPQSISTKEAYDALPSGSSYIAPDGSTRTKK